MYTKSESRNVAVPKYFRKTPTAPPDGKAKIFGIVGGVLLIGAVIGFAMAQSSDSGGLACCMPLVGLVGGALLVVAFLSYTTESSAKAKFEQEYALSEPKPKDGEMDDWHNTDLLKLPARASEQLDLTPDRFLEGYTEPLVVVGPGDSPMAAIGKDGNVRFSVHNVILVYLTQNHLVAYKCTINLQDGVPVNESTQEYLYQDIVSVSTQDESSGQYIITLNGLPQAIPSRQSFAISVASGEKISMVVALPQLSKIMRGGTFAQTNVDETIKKIRTVLRMKKA